MSRSSHCHSIYFVIGNGFVKFKRVFHNSAQLKRAHYKFRSNDMLMLSITLSSKRSHTIFRITSRKTIATEWIFATRRRALWSSLNFTIQKDHLFLITWSSFIMITYFTMTNGKRKKWTKKFTELYIMSMIHENDMWMLFICWFIVQGWRDRNRKQQFLLNELIRFDIFALMWPGVAHFLRGLISISWIFRIRCLIFTDMRSISTSSVPL